MDLSEVLIPLVRMVLEVFDMFSRGTSAWIAITMALLSVVTFSPAGALAQDEPAPFPPVQQEPELPSYDVSIALFVTASIMGPLGTFGSLGGVLGAIAQSAGGSGDGTAAVVGLAGAALLIGSIAIGITASAMHASTRRRRAGYAALPLLWADGTGGGGGLLLRF